MKNITFIIYLIILGCTSNIENKDKDDKENGETAKDEVKDENQAEDQQIKNEKETEQSLPDKNDAKLKQNK